MKECLNCKKEYENKREASKFCSGKCRVAYNRKNPKNTLAPYQVQVLYNQMVSMVSEIKELATRNIDHKFYEVCGKLFSTTTQNTAIANKDKTFQEHMNDLPSLETEYDYRTKAEEIEAGTLSRKQKDLLLQNMRTPNF